MTTSTDFVLYVNPSCSKCKNVLEVPLIKELESAQRIATIDYTVEGFRFEKERILLVLECLKNSSIQLSKIVRWDSAGVAETEQQEEILRQLMENPLLLQRPLLLDMKSKLGAIGRPTPQSMIDLLVFKKD